MEIFRKMSQYHYHMCEKGENVHLKIFFGKVESQGSLKRISHKVEEQAATEELSLKNPFYQSFFLVKKNLSIKRTSSFMCARHVHEL